jgi:hypothetical protein
MINKYLERKIDIISVHDDSVFILWSIKLD